MTQFSHTKSFGKEIRQRSALGWLEADKSTLPCFAPSQKPGLR